MADTDPMNGGRRRAASMADVARHAGVSSQTVSRVSNGLTNVDESTRERVLASMRTVGYRPNGAARALKYGRFHTVGVIMFTLETLGNVRTLDAIATEAAAADYTVTLMPVPDPTMGAVSGAYRRLSEQAVDGIIIIFEASLLDRVEITLPPGLPVVVIDSNAGSGFAVVDTDQAQGARLATEHLLSLGHRQVWHIAGPTSSFSAGHRADSWRTTLEAAGITPPPLIHGDWTTESGHRAALELAARDDVTAIFAANDQMALGAMKALHELGRDIPSDVSVVGFDDMDESRAFWPPLTTVHQNFRAVGRIAMERLLAQIEDPDDAPQTTLIPTELIVRESSGPAARR
ncbi:LacI family DNA-binding transcriptional regulator [Microbacterium sp. CFBP9034]|uniref:LacI family DNA-binding transcriptional regulator n=1 Tax=Microbacterium sp. CFBP9034 TaxID=3096540 RepID=UPI002A69A9FD|nr:LacI family DNA-binding transcriptional regulator [Microbacterium sp. CFBP9034]MDY0908678.1 LacI family DNA-binding transcriptional regulator [Microbacterium sp. CFBP9034]